MKKLFCIISAAIIGVVGSFLVTLSFIRTKSVVFDNPYSINVYYKSTTPISGNVSYYEEDDEFSDIMKKMGQSLNNSLFTQMFYDGDLDNKPVYGKTDYATYDTTMKNENLVVELIYRETKNIVCYEDGNSRVMSFTCLMIVIPCMDRYTEMVIYSSVNNDSTLKEEEYKKCTPFVVKGNPKKLLKYFDSLSK